MSVKSLRSVGNQLLDSQHAELCQTLDILARGASENSLMVTSFALARLDVYVSKHFADEERLMRESGYPRISEHTALHRSFSSRLESLRNAFPGAEMTTDMISFLSSWIDEHVAGADMDYVPWVSRCEALPEVSRL